MSRTEQEQKNLDLCVEFYEKVICEKNPRIIKNYIADRYIQHSSFPIADDYEGVFAFISHLEQNERNSKVLIRDVFVDGDNVIFFVRVEEENNPTPRLYVDRFRVENGRIAEHWDIGQDLPADLPHGNGVW